MIMDNLWDDTAALKACSLTSREWLPWARHHLFDNCVNLNSLKKLESFDALLRNRCSTLPSRCSDIKSLILDARRMNMVLQNDISADQIVEGDERSVASYRSDDDEVPHPYEENCSRDCILADARILRISRGLKDIRSLTLCEIRNLPRTDTLLAIASMFRRLEEVHLSYMHYEDVDGFIRFLAASGPLNISLKKIYPAEGPVVYIVDAPTLKLLNSSAENKAPITIKNLEFLRCSSEVHAAVMRRIHACSALFTLQLHSLSVSVPQVVPAWHLMRDTVDSVVAVQFFHYKDLPWRSENPSHSEHCCFFNCSNMNLQLLSVALEHVYPNLSHLRQLRVLHLTSTWTQFWFDDCNPECVEMLRTVTSSVLTTIIFGIYAEDRSPISEDNINWPGMDGALASLVETRPGLHVIFSFGRMLDRSTSPLDAEADDILRGRLPRFLTQGGRLDVSTLEQVNSIYRYCVLCLHV